MKKKFVPVYKCKSCGALAHDVCAAIEAEAGDVFDLADKPIRKTLLHVCNDRDPTGFLGVCELIGYNPV